MARITVEPGLALNVDVDDFLWPWETGIPVVMLHGFSRNATFWRRWIPYVTEKRRVYRPELRGFGRSDMPPEGYKYQASDILNDIVKVLDHFNIEKAHFVGESSGGVFSILFALEHADRVASMVLCDTPLVHSGSSAPETAASYALGESDSAAAMRKYGVGEWCRQTLKFRLDLKNSTKELQDWYVNEMDKTNRRTAADLNDLIRATPSREPMIKQVTAPVLLMGGDQSPIAGKDQDAFTRELKNGKIKIFKGYGHSTNVVIPEETAKAAIEFWDSL